MKKVLSFIFFANLILAIFFLEGYIIGCGGEEIYELKTTDAHLLFGFYYDDK